MNEVLNLLAVAALLFGVILSVQLWNSGEVLRGIEGIGVEVSDGETP